MNSVIDGRTRHSSGRWNPAPQNISLAWYYEHAPDGVQFRRSCAGRNLAAARTVYPVRPMSELTERTQLAVRIVREIGAHAITYYQQQDIGLDFKPDRSPVTRADKEGEELARRILDAECPADAILGEEYGAKDGSSGYRWYLDPIDGTQSFVRGVPALRLHGRARARRRARRGRRLLPCARRDRLRRDGAGRVVGERRRRAVRPARPAPRARLVRHQPRRRPLRLHRLPELRPHRQGRGARPPSRRSARGARLVRLLRPLPRRDRAGWT